MSLAGRQIEDLRVDRTRRNEHDRGAYSIVAKLDRAQVGVASDLPREAVRSKGTEAIKPRAVSPAAYLYSHPRWLNPQSVGATMETCRVALA